MFKCPKCNGDMVYEWLLAKVMCIGPTCGFDTTWQEAMKHCRVGSNKVRRYCAICKTETWCTVTEASTVCDDCLVGIDHQEGDPHAD